MQRIFTDRATCLLVVRPITLPVLQRSLSFASAIGKGIRRTKDKSDHLGMQAKRPSEKSEQQSPTSSSFSRSRLGQQQRLAEHRPPRSDQRRRTRHLKQPDPISLNAPASKPYSTAGSEFLYGTFAVKAALEADRRKFYELYIWRGQQGEDDGYDHSIHALAKARNVHINFVGGSWDQMLLKLSGQRPHNGYVLEASALPKPSISSLGALDNPGAELRAVIKEETAEDKMINSHSFTESALGGRVVPRKSVQNRFPLLLWLDCITDTGNLGAILRTAHFLGVDAVLITQHGTAPFNPITIKASAGAAEIIPILSVKQELDFVQRSQQNGWKFIAAVAPDSASTVKQLSQQGSFVAENALTENPCILMLGNEGEGLRPMMQRAADNFVSIRGARGHASGVESLNVSVAAALLMARLLSKTPTSVRKDIPHSSTLASTPEQTPETSHVF